MAGRRNSRIADRVAILSNLCNYGVRLDTRQLESDLYSLSVCCLTLSLLNGDLSYIHTDRLMSGDTWEDSDAFSWCPSPSSSLASIQYVEENDIFRMEVTGLSKDGLLSKGWLWEINQHVDVSSLKTQFEESLRRFGRGLERDKLLAEVVWHFLQLLVSRQLTTVADVIWCQTKQKNPLSPFGTDKSSLRLPDSFKEATKLVDQLFSQRLSTDLTNDDHSILFETPTLRGYFHKHLLAMLENAELWVGRADCGKAENNRICVVYGHRGPLWIFTSLSEIDATTLGGIQRVRPISWVIDDVNHDEYGNVILRSSGLTNVTWRFHELEDSEVFALI